MSYIYPVKEEYPNGSSSSCSDNSQTEYYLPAAPRPMEGLNDMGPAPFVIKTYEMVDDAGTCDIVSWSRGGQSFVVWDTNAFSNDVLPKYFKHGNFSSFVRQLNTYGFRKIDADKWEFANEAFIRFHKHLLKNIKRKKATSQILMSPPDECQKNEKSEECNRLRQEKRMLTMEIKKLKHQQMEARDYLKQIELKIQGREKKQQQMMSFLAKVMLNPEFFDKLVCKKKELEEEGSKRRRRMNVGVKVEPTEFGDLCGFQVDELQALALEMQGYGRVARDEEERNLDEVEELGDCGEELDEGFWDELLSSEGFDDEECQREGENGFTYR